MNLWCQYDHCTAGCWCCLYAIWNAVFRYAAELNTEQKRYEVVSVGLLVMWNSSFICVGTLLLINNFGIYIIHILSVFMLLQMGSSISTVMLLGA